MVELVGGLEPARTFIHRALAGRKHVVTANKSLLAAEGYSLLQAAAIQNVRFGFEASVCEGSRLFRAEDRALLETDSNRCSEISMKRVISILTRMSEDGCDLKDALKDAQSKGFAAGRPAGRYRRSRRGAKTQNSRGTRFRTRAAHSTRCYVEGITKLNIQLRLIRTRDGLRLSSRLAPPRPPGHSVSVEKLCR